MTRSAHETVGWALEGKKRIYRWIRSTDLEADEEETLATGTRPRELIIVADAALTSPLLHSHSRSSSPISHVACFRSAGEGDALAPLVQAKQKWSSFYRWPFVSTDYSTRIMKVRNMLAPLTSHHLICVANWTHDSWGF